MYTTFIVSAMVVGSLILAAYLANKEAEQDEWFI